MEEDTILLGKITRLIQNPDLKTKQNKNKDLKAQGRLHSRGRRRNEEDGGEGAGRVNAIEVHCMYVWKKDY
jgi:hypothetical protein